MYRKKMACRGPFFPRGVAPSGIELPTSRVSRSYVVEESERATTCLAEVELRHTESPSDHMGTVFSKIGVRRAPRTRPQSGCRREAKYPRRDTRVAGTGTAGPKIRRRAKRARAAADDDERRGARAGRRRAARGPKRGTRAGDTRVASNGTMPSNRVRRSTRAGRGAESTRDRGARRRKQQQQRARGR